MKLKNMQKEELELLSYTDLTYKILGEAKKSMNTPTVFRMISDLLEYSDDEYAAKIGDYYTSLTIDKRFVLLENNEWDIRDRHAIELVLDDEEEISEEVVDEEVIEEETEELEEDDIVVLDEDETLDDDDNDLASLSIIEDDEEEE